MFGKVNLDASKTWSKGHYTDAAQFIDDKLNVIHKSIENLDSSQRIQFIHNIDGGTGKGLTTLITTKLKNEHPNLPIMLFSACCFNLAELVTIPTITEPYNIILSINSMIDNCDATFIIDDNSLFEMFHVFEIFAPSHDD